MSRKKILYAAVCLALIVAMVLPAVASAEVVQKPQSGVTQTMQCSKQETKRLEQMVKKTNQKILQLVKKAQMTPWNDVAELIAETNALIADVFAYADSIGAVLACEYTEYIVDGQSVLIDPIRIIRL